ncbi:hypothetical protein RHSIM_Rhsim10G0102000 [Rhododendron simsii]|uniref:F-box domain-containing protein n=1 Tax=Rhododendron simsii TaxID=118357 RepID=A0A834GEP9_RHOSS|nr:hypothetical protein RHSIM_Rhsim10G0102000 [Rhododendron simsii]
MLTHAQAKSLEQGSPIVATKEGLGYHVPEGKLSTVEGALDDGIENETYPILTQSEEGVQATIDELREVNLSDEEENKPTLISANLVEEEAQRINAQADSLASLSTSLSLPDRETITVIVGERRILQPLTKILEVLLFFAVTTKEGDEDWRKPFINYLQHGNMDCDSKATQPTSDLLAPIIREEKNHHSTIPLEKNKEESIAIEVGGEEEKRETITAEIFSKLPAKNEIVLEIFSRLPPKTAAKFKCVSKTISDITRQPSFTTKHSHNYKPIASTSSIGFFHQKVTCPDQDVVMNLVLDDVEFTPAIGPEPGCLPDPSLNILKQRVDEDFVELIDSCNGLLLCSNTDSIHFVTTCFVCNPLTREKVVIPHPCPRSTRVLFLLIADLNSHGYLQYKVVCLFRPKGTDQGTELLVFSSETGTWEEIEGRLPELHRETVMNEFPDWRLQTNEKNEMTWDREDRKDFENLSQDISTMNSEGWHIKRKAMPVVRFKIIGYNPGSETVFLWENMDCDLTRESNFTTKHSHKYKPNSSSSPTGFFHQRITCPDQDLFMDLELESNDIEFTPVIGSDPGRLPDSSLNFLKQRGDEDFVDLIDSCNGLLLCSNTDSVYFVTTYFVCNPLTREDVALPHPCCRGSNRVSYSLIADLNSHGYIQYKVVCLSRPEVTDSGTKLFVLSSETGVWEEMEERLPELHHETVMGSKVFFNGSLFWDCFEDEILVCHLNPKKSRRCYELIEAPRAPLGRSWHLHTDEKNEIMTWKREDGKEFETLSQVISTMNLEGWDVKRKAMPIVRFKIIGYNPVSERVFLWVRESFFSYGLRLERMGGCSVYWSCVLAYKHSPGAIQIRKMIEEEEEEEREIDEEEKQKVGDSLQK